jgi:hypothetical protein
LEFVSPLKKSQSLNFTSRLGIGYKNIVPFYKKIKENKIGAENAALFYQYWNK